MLTEKQSHSLRCDSLFCFPFGIFGFVISSLTLNIVCASTSSTVTMKQLNSWLQETFCRATWHHLSPKHISFKSTLWELISLYAPPWWSFFSLLPLIQLYNPLRIAKENYFCGLTRVIRAVSEYMYYSSSLNPFPLSFILIVDLMWHVQSTKLSRVVDSVLCCITYVMVQRSQKQWNKQQATADFARRSYGTSRNTQGTGHRLCGQIQDK